jgi:single-strand DNA-binding protein
MNNWSFTGNLGKDCEVAATQNGTVVCKFSVAVKSGFGDNVKTTWVNCRLFGKRAEGQLPQYLVKGQQVAITGEAELAEWETNGQPNKALMLNVNGLDLVGGSHNANQQPQQGGYQPQQGYQQQRPQQAQQPQPQMGMDDEFQDDIPF